MVEIIKKGSPKPKPKVHWTCRGCDSVLAEDEAKIKWNYGAQHDPIDPQAQIQCPVCREYCTVYKPHHLTDG